MKTLLVSTVFLLLCFLSIIFIVIYTAPDKDAGNASDDQSWIGLTKAVYMIGEWQPYLKTINNCTNFRNAATPDLFKIWPEPSGDFCCEDRQGPSSTIASYVHSARNGRFLHPIPYYDVGIINDKSPYWKSWRPDRISQRDITNLVYCEVNDLKKFYVRRFWVEALAKQGLFFSAAPSILLVELLVLFSGLWKRNFRQFPWFLRSETPVWDLVHLCLLGVNGSILMENVGHSDPCGWEAVLLFNSAVVYTYLTALSILSAVLNQVALWSGAHTVERLRLVEGMDHQGKDMQIDPAGEEVIASAVKKHKVEKDWQHQRMMAQGAVFFVASLYCTFVTVYSRDDFVSWLLGIIILGLVWSFSVSLAMLWMDLKLVYVCYVQRREARAEEHRLERLVAIVPQPQDFASGPKGVQRASEKRFTRSPTL